MATRHHKQLAEQSVRKAQEVLGDGWKHVSKDLQWGLVSTEILAVLMGQDETVPAENVRTMMEQVTSHARWLMGF